MGRIVAIAGGDLSSTREINIHTIKLTNKTVTDSFCRSLHLYNFNFLGRTDVNFISVKAYANISVGCGNFKLCRIK